MTGPRPGPRFGSRPGPGPDRDRDRDRPLWSIRGDAQRHGRPRLGADRCRRACRRRPGRRASPPRLPRALRRPLGRAGGSAAERGTRCNSSPAEPQETTSNGCCWSSAPPWSRQISAACFPICNDWACARTRPRPTSTFCEAGKVFGTGRRDGRGAPRMGFKEAFDATLPLYARLSKNT